MSIQNTCHRKFAKSYICASLRSTWNNLIVRCRDSLCCSQISYLNESTNTIISKFPTGYPAVVERRGSAAAFSDRPACLVRCVYSCQHAIPKLYPGFYGLLCGINCFLNSKMISLVITVAINFYFFHLTLQITGKLQRRYDCGIRHKRAFREITRVK